MKKFERSATALATIMLAALLAKAENLNAAPVKCPTPSSVEDCQTFTFACQAQMDTCEEILVEAANSYPSIAGLILTPDGGIIADGQRFTMDSPAQRGATFVPDAYSFTSQLAAQWVSSEDEIGIDLYEVWESNGDTVNTCQEYTYEKYLGLTEALRLAEYKANEPLTLFQHIFGPPGDDGSLGTHGITGNAFIGRDGVPFDFENSPFDAPPQPKNEFFDLQETVAGPSLETAMRYYSWKGGMTMGVVSTNYGTEQWTLARHKEFSDAVLPLEFNPGVLAPVVADEGFGPGAGPGDYLVEGADVEEPIEYIEITGQVPTEFTGGKTMRRYLPAELTERHALQKRFVALKTRWANQNRKYPNSQWTVAELGDDRMCSPQSINTLPPPVPAPTRGASNNKTADTPTNTTPVSSGTNWQAEMPSNPDVQDLLDTQTPELVLADTCSSESWERSAIILQSLALYTEAAELGCLEPGVTACDWSPELFSEQLLETTTRFIDNTHKRCESFITTPYLDHYQGLAFSVIDEPEFNPDGSFNPLFEYNCDINSAFSFTRATLESLFQNVENCRDQRVNYLEAKALLEEELAAISRLATNTDLLDPVTGEVRAPGNSDGYDQEQRDSWFGVLAALGGSFGADIKPNECSLQLGASGFAKIEAWAGNQNIKIVDILGSADTEEGKLVARGRVFGVNLFPEQEINLSNGIEEIDFGFTDESSKSKGKGVDASFTIYIPVPLTFGVGAAGQVSVNSQGFGTIKGFGLGNGLTTDQCPSADYLVKLGATVKSNAYVSAAIGIPGAQVGVQANLTLVDADIGFVGDIGLTFDDAAPEGVNFPKNLQLTFASALKIDVLSLKGNVVLYYELGACPLCSQGEKVLTSWSGYNFNKVPFDSDYSVYIGDLVTGLF